MPRNAAAPTLFDTSQELQISDGAVVLRGFASAAEQSLADGVAAVTARAPFRHMVTRGGYRMSVAMTNCGAAGWISDRRGYRYERNDPERGECWPAMPLGFTDLAARAAAAAGYPGFEPDVCLVNRYEPGTRMTLHRDRDERDFDAPIVSVSLGLPATFLFGGLRRTDRAQRIALAHGDVVVWGGVARLNFHGVLPLAPGEHRATGRARINLTFRRAR